MPSTLTTLPQHRPRIGVVGGGISGLAAARSLLDLIPSAEVVLFEASDHLGGVLQTEKQNGFLLEHGADNFITTPSWGVDFFRRLDLETQLLETNSEHRRAFVVHKGKLQAMPAGFTVMAPSRIWPIATTPILSLRGKLRMAAELMIPRSVPDEKESLADFVRRRLGKEVYERLVQPLIAGIYTGAPEQLSLGATMPRFLQMEQDQGSLIRALWKQQKTQRTTLEQSSGARYSQFVTPRQGMTDFIQAVSQRLRGATILLNAPVERMASSPKGWRLSVGGVRRQFFDVDGLVLAIPAHHSSSLLRSVAGSLAAELGKITYGSCALVSMGFRRNQIGHALNGFGFVVPATEGRTILSTSFSSIKYPGRAPEGHVLLRTFVGGACQTEFVDLDDAHLERLVQDELADLLAIDGKPVMCHIVRQKQAMPQYYVGHEAIVRKIEQQLANHHNLALAGNGLQGIGMPSCIHSGELAAQKIVNSLESHSQRNSLDQIALSTPMT